MTILELHSFERWDGPALHILDLIKGLKDLQQDVILACNSWPEMKRAEEVCPVLNLGTPRISFRHVPILANVIRKNGVDIIHTHGGKTPWIALAAAKLAGRARVVNTWHGLRKVHGDILHKWFYKKVAFIAVSEILRRQIETESNHLIKNVTTIHNGIDIDKFTSADKNIRAENNIPANSFVVGYLGRLHPEKGVNFLIDAVNRLDNVYLLVVGWDTVKDYAQELRNCASSRVRFCGVQNDVVPFLEAIDALVLPSVCSESFGLVICEAMALEKPVISTNTGGQKEIISNNENGFLISPSSSILIEDKIKLLSEDKELYERISKAGKQTVLEKFTHQIMAQNTLDFFYSLYKKHNA